MVLDSSTQTETFNLQIGKFKLCVIKYQGEIFIPDHEGLKVVGAGSNWIEDLNQSHRKKRELRSKGFSFKKENLQYNSPNVQVGSSRSWEDWLIIWEYFCNRGNVKAASLLRHLANYGLEHYLQEATWSVICTISDQKIHYSAIKGATKHAEFTSSQQECVNYILYNHKEKSREGQGKNKGYS
jgi:hypothetical protein